MCFIAMFSCISVTKFCLCSLQPAALAHLPTFLLLVLAPKCKSLEVELLTQASWV